MNSMNLPTPDPTPWSARVLVADDDPAMRDYLVELLRDEGCAVVDAIDGADASQKLWVLEDPWEYELVITDFRMPVLSGLELARKLGRNGPAIILMSAFLDEHVARQAIALGVSAVLEKPFAARRLMGIVRGLIGPL